MNADAVLRDRARQLARPVTTHDDAPRRPLLRFRRDGERFAVDLHAVHQVVRLDSVARLPVSARPLLAVAPLGDRVIPVLDLAGMAGTTTRPASLAWGIAVDAGPQSVALVADEVLDVVEVADAEITPTGTAEADPSSVASGITAGGDALVDLGAVRSLLTKKDNDTLSSEASPPLDSTRSPRA